MARTGLVLSGGGARGAYEVGVVAGLVEALGRRAEDPPLFSVFAGTSVGAINATYLASRAQRGDLGIGVLEEVWRDLHLRTQLRLDLPGFFGWGRDADRVGHAILDVGPIERLVRERLPWRDLRQNIDAGVSLVLTALHVGSGRSTMFVDARADQPYVASKDVRRAVRREPITPAHVMASAAIPLVFPARRVGDGYYCDGGLRFNTPISPALRAGAERLVVISVMRAAGADTVEGGAAEAAYPNAFFLLGKVLNALLLDPMTYDLQVLHRTNQLIDAIERRDDETRGRVRDVLTAERGLPYKRVDTLVFSPSEDIGRLAGLHLRDHLPGLGLDRWLYGALRRAAREENGWEADLAAYLLFEGGFAAKLIALGRRDALRRAEEIRAFFQDARP